MNETLTIKILRVRLTFSVLCPENIRPGVKRDLSAVRVLYYCTAASTSENLPRRARRYVLRDCRA